MNGATKNLAVGLIVNIAQVRAELQKLTSEIQNALKGGSASGKQEEIKAISADLKAYQIKQNEDLVREEVQAVKAREALQRDYATYSKSQIADITREDIVRLRERVQAVKQAAIQEKQIRQEVAAQAITVQKAINQQLLATGQFGMGTKAREEMAGYYKELEKAGTATDKVRTSTKGLYGDSLHLRGGIKGFISDLEMMIKVQMRWYAARAILFLPVQAAQEYIKTGVQYATAIDKANADILRWGATSGKVTDQMRQDAQVLVMEIRKNILQIPITFEDAFKAVESFVGAGVSTKVVKAITKDILQLKATFPEINMEQFVVALTGTVNVFRGQIKGATNDAEVFRVVMEQLLRAQAVGIIRPEQFTKVLSYMAEMAKLTGFTTKQMFALSVAVTDTGTQASRAARLISSLWGQLSQPKAIGAMKSIGIQINEDISLGEQFTQIMTQLQEKLGVGGATSVKAVGFLSKIANKDQQRILLAIIDTLAKYGDLIPDIANATGALAAGSEVAASSIKGQWIMLVSTLNELSVRTTLTSNVLKNLVSGGLDFARGLLTAADSAGELGLKISDLGAAGQIGYGVMRSLVDIGGALKDIFVGLATPIKIVIDLIKDLTGGLIELKDVLMLLVNITLARLGISLVSKIAGMVSIRAILASVSSEVGILGGGLAGLTAVVPKVLASFTGFLGVSIAIGLVVTAFQKMSEPLEEAKKAVKELNDEIEKMPLETVKASIEILKFSLIEIEESIASVKNKQSGAFGGTMTAYTMHEIETKPFMFTPLTAAQKELRDLVIERTRDQQALNTALEREKQLLGETTTKEKKKGTGNFDVADKVKSNASELLAYHNQYWNAILAIDRDNYNLQQHLLDNAHKLGLVSDQDYYDKTLEIAEKAEVKSQIDIISKRAQLEADITQKRKDILRNPKAKADAIEALEEEYQAKSKVIDEQENRIKNLITSKVDDRNAAVKLLDKKLFIEEMNFELSMTKIMEDQKLSVILNSLKEEETAIKWAYDHMEITATTYYDSLVKNAQKELATRLTIFDKEYYATVDTQAKIFNAENVTEDEQKKIARDLSELTAKWENDKVNTSQATLDKIVQFNRDASQSIEKIWQNSGVKGVIRKVFDDLKKDWGGIWKDMYDTVKGIFQDLKSSISDVFFDAMQGKSKSWADYFMSLLSAIERRLADVAAQWIVGGTSGSGGLIGLITSALGLVIPGGSTAGGAWSASGASIGAGSSSYQNFMSLGMASGGSVYPWGTYPVGESGVELFKPATAGTIIPNSQIDSKQSTSQPPIINIHINAMDASSFQSWAYQNRKVFANTILAAGADNHRVRRQG